MSEIINKYKGFFGVTKAVVTRTDDPKGLGRVQVYIPAYHGGTSADSECVGATGTPGKYPWAQVTGHIRGMYVGSVVYVLFEGGDSRSPVCISRIGNEAVIDIYSNNLVSYIKDGNFYQVGSYGASSGTVVGGDYTSGSGKSYMVSGLSDIVSNLIMTNESGGNYAAINYNDNGAISIGLLQWHAGRAQALMKEIRAEDPEEFARLCNSYSVPGFESFVLNGDWSHYTISSGSAEADLIKAILSSPASKKIQDNYINETSSQYIEHAMELGLSDPKAIAYACDIMNQFGTHEFDEQFKQAAAAGGTIDDINKYYYGSFVNNNPYTARRDKVESMLDEMEEDGDFAKLNSTSNTEKLDAYELYWPVPGSYHITSKFGPRNISYGSKYHKGIDIGHNGIPTRPITSAINGTCTYVGEKQYRGKLVDVSYGQLLTRYQHLSSIGVRVGDQISIGQQVGNMGNTGGNYGYHLHFEILINNNAKDPLPYFVDVVINGDYAKPV